MSKTLSERLDDAKEILDGIHSAIQASPEDLKSDARDYFSKVLEGRNELVNVQNLIKVRLSALKYLDNLGTEPDSEGNVLFGSIRVHFAHARLMGVQAYLSTAWSISDTLCRIAGRLLCTPDAGQNEAAPSQLVSHFISKSSAKKQAASSAFSPLRPSFGWPIGISYAIRNLFLHEAGNLGVKNFFVDMTALSEFRIAEEGWSQVIEVAQGDYNVDAAMHRVTTGWVDSPTDDLRLVLQGCEREMDSALGSLLISACHGFRASVACLLEQD
jgi:hypothetical protein